MSRKKKLIYKVRKPSIQRWVPKIFRDCILVIPHLTSQPYLPCHIFPALLTHSMHILLYLLKKTFETYIWILLIFFKLRLRKKKLLEDFTKNLA